MAVKVKENFEKTRHVEKYIFRREGNVRYYDRIPFNQQNFKTILNIIFYSKVYLRIKILQNSTGQLSNLLFPANPSEHSWQSFASI